MALINCPECGKQISDKAEMCPHCGIEVQKVLVEIREKQRIQRKKRKKRIIVSIASAFLVGTIVVLAYLYSIDALNSIPAEYRKQTEDYFKICESAISCNNFEKENELLKTLKGRMLTNKQSNRVLKIEKTIIETELCALEKTIDRYVRIANNSDTKMDNGIMALIKKMAILNTYQLDAVQTERLKKLRNNYTDLILEEIEKNVGMLEADHQDLYSINKAKQYVEILKMLDLSTTQRTRLDDAIAKAERIKKQKEENQYKQLLKTIKDEYITLLNINNLSNGDYEEGYFLHDIDNDGIPEIWIKSGTCRADTRMLVYQYNNGIRKIYDAGAGSFYKGEGYVLDVYGQMGYATWKKLTYNGFSITSTIIYEEDINDTNRDYREPEEKYINFYPLNNKQPILNAFKTK
jgi:hypothetical protein